jgi:hypothetical protein
MDIKEIEFWGVERVYIAQVRKNNGVMSKW